MPPDSCPPQPVPPSQQAMPFPVFPKRNTGNPKRRTAVSLQLAVSTTLIDSYMY